MFRNVLINSYIKNFIFVTYSSKIWSVIYSIKKSSPRPNNADF